MLKLAISIGDINGVGLEIALKAHQEIKKLCEPIYCVDTKVLNQALKLLNKKLPHNFESVGVDAHATIEPQKITKESGSYSFASFTKAIELVDSKIADGIVTLPIHKKAWELAGVPYKGHTDMLRDLYKKDAIMMLGCKEMFVALYTEHIPLKEVASTLKEEKLNTFLKTFYNELKPKKVGVLALNPHAGDDGVLGNEELTITKAIQSANKHLKSNVFVGPLVPDVAFTPHLRENFTYFIAMYHDQGLAPLKALYFDKSINVSLNLPIVRTSVDHGTAFDIAYTGTAKTTSYYEAVKFAIEQIERTNKR